MYIISRTLWQGVYEIEYLYMGEFQKRQFESLQEVEAFIEEIRASLQER